MLTIEISPICSLVVVESRHNTRTCQWRRGGGGQRGGRFEAVRSHLSAFSCERWRAGGGERRSVGSGAHGAASGLFERVRTEMAETIGWSCERANGAAELGAGVLCKVTRSSHVYVCVCAHRGDEHKAALRHLVHALLAQILRSIARKL